MAGVAACGLLGGCTLITDSFLTNDFSGDPFPIDIETTSGAIVVGLREPGAPDREVVLDLLSPFTLVDPGPAAPPSVAYLDLILLGQAGPGGSLDRPRARFREAQLVSLHPCVDECAAGAPDTCDPAQCSVGTPAAPRPFTGILGADVLAGDAVRLRLGDNQMFVLPDVGGSDRDRSLICEAVFGSPYRGGGTLVIGGTELPFGNRRITLKACLGADPDPPVTVDATQLRPTGADAQLVVSTSIGTSILDQSAFGRYLFAHPDPLDQPAPLVPGVVYLPSGPVFGGLTKIKRLSLVASSNGNSLAPCRQVYAHRLEIAHGPIPRDQCVTPGEPAGIDPLTGVFKFDCVCKDTSEFCDVPATLELAPPGEIQILVVPDDEPTLQALRTELRPDQAEIDGLLGTDVLRGAELDVDYPHDRLIARCAGPGCVARPQLVDQTDRCPVGLCVYGTQPAGCP